MGFSRKNPNRRFEDKEFPGDTGEIAIEQLKTPIKKRSEISRGAHKKFIRSFQWF